MCTAVQVGEVDPGMPEWRPDSVTIVVSDQLTREQQRLQVRALLAVLTEKANQGDQAVSTPDCQRPATCWCGEPVALPGDQAEEMAGARIGAPSAAE